MRKKQNNSVSPPQCARFIPARPRPTSRPSGSLVPLGLRRAQGRRRGTPTPGRSVGRDGRTSPHSRAVVSVPCIFVCRVLFFLYNNNNTLVIALIRLARKNLNSYIYQSGEMCVAMAAAIAHSYPNMAGKLSTS